MKTKKTSGISLVIPVYNEQDLVVPCLSRCVSSLSQDFETFEIIVVDDGSTDKTAEILESMALTENRIRPLKNLINLNFGCSVLRGMAAATLEYVVPNAIDLPLAPESLAPLVEQAEKCDILVLERTSYSGYVPWRILTSWINRRLLKILFAHETKGTSDFNFTQIYRRSVLHKIWPLAKSPAFWNPEMIFRGQRLGLRIESRSVEYYPRKSGKGAFGKPHDIMWALYDMFRFRLLTIFRNSDGRAS
jgi:glycosyltransferase involved in cell wall biosynthesis